MHGAQDLLAALAMVLGVAAVTTLAFQRLRQPVVLGYMIAGLIVGRHVPIPLVADQNVVHTMSELGVILLMFSLGLQFSVRKLVSVGPASVVTAVVECSFMLWLGFAVGRAFGFTVFESILTGATIAISSTTIVAKAFEGHRVAGALREIVFGVLIVEDVIAVLLMATLTTIATGRGLSLSSLAATSSKLVAFLVALIVLGLLLIPRIMRGIVALKRPETTLVASMGICFGIALATRSFGYSVALGAFIAGALVAESGEHVTIERLVRPVRDLFAAIFFVSVGMMLDPAVLVRHWLPIVVLTVVVVVGKVLGVSTGAFLTGSGTRSAVQAGMSLAQIGEFSFIIASLGVTLKKTDGALYSMAVAVSALTTLLTPWFIHVSGPVASWVDHRLPTPLQTFASLYASWLEQLRSAKKGHRDATALRRLFRLLLVDAAILAAILVGTELEGGRVATLLARKTGIGSELATALVVGCALAAAVPFCVGLLRVSRKLGLTLAGLALPLRHGDTLDLAAAPRRALVVALQLVSFLLVGVPLVAVTQPLLEGFGGAALLLAALVIVGLAFWRKAADLHGHVRAGAQVIVEALAAQSKSHPDAASSEAFERLEGLMASFGAPEAIELGPGSPAVGKTLGQLNVRARTGAIVLAVTHGEEEAVLVPGPDECLRDGDILAVAGTTEAVRAAAVLLTAQS